MRILSETIREMSKQGVSVRYYPEKTFDEYKERVYREEYNFCFEYNPMFKDKTQEELDKHAREFAERNVDSKASRNEYDANLLYIEYGDKLIIKKISVKSKEITVDYIRKEIEKNEKAYSGAYGNFALKMQKMLRDNGIERGFQIYPTTYGIGVWIYYNFGVEYDIKRVTEIMEKYGIEYYNEYSDAGWVYRFKVSKKNGNLEKIA